MILTLKIRRHDLDNPMKIPILILTYDRPTMLKDMIDSIVSYTEDGTYELIICDNCSTQPEMKDLLQDLEKRFRVLYNTENKLFEGLNIGLEFVQSNEIPYFIITDPDLVLKKDIPKNWILKMKEILDKTNYPKVGLALDINFTQDNSYIDYIKYGQEAFWKNKINFDFLEDDCYEGLVDTTMAMYRKDTFSYWDNKLVFDRSHGIEGGGWISLFHFNNKYKDTPLRIAGRFTVEHIGWWLTKKYLIDFPYYLEHSSCSDISSSFQRVYLDRFFSSLPKSDFEELYNRLSKDFQTKFEYIKELRK